MIGELDSRQILSLARQGASAEEISKELSLELELVKLVMNRQNIGSDQDRDINDEQLRALRDRAFSLAMSNDENISARLTMFLIERDKPKNVSSGNPIMLINNAIIGAREKFEKLKEAYSETDKQD